MSTLRVQDLVAGYTDEAVVRGVSLELTTGSITTIIGANGAGKTSTLRALVGALPPRSGTLELDGEAIRRPRPRDMLRRGVVLVPEGRGIFAGLSVQENLELGTYATTSRRRTGALVEEMLELFPRLRERAKVSGALLSGGEQQMLAIARALMAEPRFLLLDEPSMGLAPKLVGEVAELIRAQAERGVGVLLVEQNAALGLELADWALVLERGAVVRQGPAEELHRTGDVEAAYLGLSGDA
jgi:branched-chain amino acid transport system ATP-binding protein